MNKNEKIILVSIGLIVLGIFYFYKQGKQDAVGVEEESETESVKPDKNKVLKKGSKGLEVGILQKALKTITVDEDFGAITEARLKKVMGVTETSINKYNEFLKNKK